MAKSVKKSLQKRKYWRVCKKVEFPDAQFCMVVSILILTTTVAQQFRLIKTMLKEVF